MFMFTVDTACLCIFFLLVIKFLTALIFLIAIIFTALIAIIIFVDECYCCARFPFVNSSHTADKISFAQCVCHAAQELCYRIMIICLTYCKRQVYVFRTQHFHSVFEYLHYRDGSVSANH